MTACVQFSRDGHLLRFLLPALWSGGDNLSVVCFQLPEARMIIWCCLSSAILNKGGNLVCCLFSPNCLK